MPWAVAQLCPTLMPLLVAIHSKSHQLPFNSRWNVHVLHNLPPDTNHITCHHLELSHQFALSSGHSAVINLRLYPFNFTSALPPFLSCTHSGVTFVKLHKVPSCVHIHYSLIIESHLWSSAWVYVCLSSGALFSFLFLFLFLLSVLSFPCGL